MSTMNKLPPEARRHYEIMSRLHRAAMLKRGVQFNSLADVESFVGRMCDDERGL